MDTRKRSGRYKRLDAIRGERRRQKQKQQLATLLIVGGGVLLVVAIIVIIALGSNKTLEKTSTPIAITPFSRPMANGSAMGDPNALVQFVEYSDFQCPGCLYFYQQIEPILVSEYISTGKVYFTYRSMGKWIGSESVAAAEAAYCAGDQNKFWEYHDILFTNWTGENVGDFTNKRLKAFAESVGLDMNAFSTCLNNHKYNQKVTQDHDDGIKAGVTYTPSLFINGQKYTGSFDYTGIKAAIDAALAGK
jgi:protein-disulfide isomerase